MEELPSRQIEANEKKAGPGTRRVCVLVRAMMLALHLKLNKHSFFFISHHGGITMHKTASY